MIQLSRLSFFGPVHLNIFFKFVKLFDSFLIILNEKELDSFKESADHFVNLRSLSFLQI